MKIISCCTGYATDHSSSTIHPFRGNSESFNENWIAWPWNTRRCASPWTQLSSS